ncbi:hypothetical protein [Deinococcus humi]|uniref:Uncharacterized protein n=1 Tax=Deinococcus humi TaxID=662880 RepID=A0A7W8JSI7_9DEIO|nr:hypothetical protein [Deinococcus humi]MBB5362003.1 hypothetical protein [Deinococcus humi]GGO22573.1 hypothetical protein GCM10008949_09920 [Deinococcus humi]
MTPQPSRSLLPRGTREQQVGRLSLVMALTGGGLAVLGAVLVAVGQGGQGELFSLVKGMGFGILSALPLFFAALTVRAVLLMDEYMRALQMQATSIAFLITMVVAGGLIAMEAAFKFQTPSFVYYAVGMLSWAVVSAVLGLRNREA